MKFQDCMCKGKAIMCQLPFSVINAVTLTFDPKINRAHPRLMESMCVKFNHDRCRFKGKEIMRQLTFSVINAL